MNALISRPISVTPRRSAGRLRPRASRRSGFTLLELLLVLGILVVIGGLASVAVFSASDAANIDATKTQLNKLKTVLDLYRLRYRSYPESLDNLIEGPSDSSSGVTWTGSMLDPPEVPKDAWQREITYSLDGNQYELRSPGIDGVLNTEDDIVLPEA